jgi:hypothetical protein
MARTDTTSPENTLCASIERAAEARHRDRHRQQHQCNKRNRIVLQIFQRSTPWLLLSSLAFRNTGSSAFADDDGSERGRVHCIMTVKPSLRATGSRDAPPERHCERSEAIHLAT